MENEFDHYREWKPEEPPEMVEPESEAMYAMSSDAPTSEEFVRYFRRLHGDDTILGVVRRNERAQLIAMVQATITNINEQAKQHAQTTEMQIGEDRKTYAELYREQLLRDGESDENLFDVVSPHNAERITDVIGENLAPVSVKFEPGYIDEDESTDTKLYELHNRMATVATKLRRVLRGHGGR